MVLVVLVALVVALVALVVDHPAPCCSQPNSSQMAACCLFFLHF
jgi:hypothetical protein